jgi:hypothetical protein
MLDKLLKDKQYVVTEGVTISCAEQINISIFRKGTETIIKFGSPFVYVHLSKFNILEIKRKVDSIKFGPKTYTICIDNFPDITKNR